MPDFPAKIFDNDESCNGVEGVFRWGFFSPIFCSELFDLPDEVASVMKPGFCNVGNMGGEIWIFLRK